MRIVSWNIRAGGGRRVAGIAAQLEAWAPDIVVLSEFRGTPPSAWLAGTICDLGLAHQRSSVTAATPSLNGLLVASRWPIADAGLAGLQPEPARWLPVLVDAPQTLLLAAMHIPNAVSGRKWPYMEALAALTEAWSAGPALLAGDTNSGRPGIDEQSPVFGPRYTAWFDRMEAAGWHDAFRHLHPEQLEYTWYSPNRGNGFRLDQAFVNRELLPRVAAVHYAWGGDGVRRDALSDHAALIVDLLD